MMMMIMCPKPQSPSNVTSVGSSFNLTDDMIAGKKDDMIVGTMQSGNAVEMCQENMTMIDRAVTNLRYSANTYKYSVEIQHHGWNRGKMNVVLLQMLCYMCRKMQSTDSVRSSAL